MVGIVVLSVVYIALIFDLLKSVLNSEAHSIGVYRFSALGKLLIHFVEYLVSLGFGIDILSSVELTPKETFYCIMQYYGKTEQQKAQCFCCTEQALRSTKSRLGKKLDLSRLADK